MNIRSRLLAGFALVILISAATGLYSISAIDRISALTGELYDRPLMASSFALSATVDFERADRLLSDAALAGAGDGLHAREAAITASEASVADDLRVVEQRFPEARGGKMIDDVRKPLADWDVLMKHMIVASADQLPVMLAAQGALRDKIEGNLDILVEAAKEDGLNFRQDAAADGKAASWMLVGATGLIVAGGILIALAVARGISRPVVAITKIMSRLAAGDTGVVIPAIANRGEIGTMARAVEVFKQRAIENQRLNEASAANEQSMEQRRRTAMDLHTVEFGVSVSGVMDLLVKSAGEMRGAAREMSKAALEARQSTSSAVDGATTSSNNLASVASAAEEMAASVHEISKQVLHVTAAVREAVGRAAETDAQVAGLTTAADRIGDVVRLISEIAGQTNMLALNATIEAARAGDAGRGFAVVAGEVKALAAQTAQATQQIGSQIAAIRVATSNAAVAVREVGKAIGQVEQVATAIAAAVEEQAGATREISGNVQNVTLATSAVTQAMADVLTTAERADTASRSVLAAADEVGGTADILRSEVDEFLARVKRDDANERRAFERVPGAGVKATLRSRGHGEITAAVRDISRGGIVLLCQSPAPAGTEVEVDLPAGGTVAGRISRSDNGAVVIAFRQSPAAAASVDRVIEVITRVPRAAAA